MRTMPGNILTVDALAAEVEDGSMLAMPRDISGAPMAAVRALVRRRVRDLDLLTVPVGGIHADLLIGAGAVRSIETSAVSLGEYGEAPRFVAAVRAGTIALKDATCPAIYASLQAAEKGIPFMPLRGILGSDVLANRSDWKVIDNPFGADDPIVALPAIKPDVALIHSPLGDRFGNVWLGRNREHSIIAHAAKRTFATVERIVDDNLLLDRKLLPGCLSELYVTGVAEARLGAWPMGLSGEYERDGGHLAEYARLAATEEGFVEYLRTYVLHAEAAE